MKRKVTPLSLEQLAAMKVRPNTLFFKPQRDSFDPLVTEGGIELPTMFEQGRHFCMRGTVLKIGERTAWPFNEADCFWSYCPPTREVNVGDEILVTKKSVIGAFSFGFEQRAERIFEVEGHGICLMLDFWDIAAVVMGERLKMVNGWCLIRLLDEEKDYGIEVPGHLKKKPAPYFAEVLSVNKYPVINFRDEYPNDIDVPVAPGDIVFLVKAASLPLDTDINSPFAGLRRIQRYTIQGKLSGYDSYAVKAGERVFHKSYKHIGEK